MKHYSFEIDVKTSGKANKNATLTCFIADRFFDRGKEKLPPAVIITPGGGYGNTGKREGEAIAMAFLEKGVDAFVLDYSCAPARFPQAIVECAFVFDYVRSNSQEFGIDENKIGLCGGSAGGHLALSYAIYYNSEILSDYISINSNSLKPDFLILCYPVVTSGEFTHKNSILHLLGDKVSDEYMLDIVSLEKHITKDLPKTFIWHTQEDQTVPVENSLLLATALRKNNVPFELHIYQKGPHSLSLGDFTVSADKNFGEFHQCSGWFNEAIRFIYDF